jgi:isopenicillin-N N-acyltransferase-like protein
VSPLIRVQGSHAEVGTQIGVACRAAIRRVTTISAEQLPDGRSLGDQLVLASKYRLATQELLPWLLTELDATADEAGVDRDILFAVSVEEIWPGRDTTARVPTPAFRGCTDLAATSPATLGQRTLIGHNNDLPSSTQQDVSAIEWRVDGQPTVFSLGVGPWLSAAWNDTGLSITGNELAANDERIGVPRLLLMTAVTRARSLNEAQALAIHASRASSYNWLLADADGLVVELEGSGPAVAELRVDDRGLLHHENHYVDPSMHAFERSAHHADRSNVRRERVSQLLSALEPGAVTPAHLRAILSDHENAPESICRHAASEHDMETVFWAIADPKARQVTYGLRPPCIPGAETYLFD